MSLRYLRIAFVVMVAAVGGGCESDGVGGGTEGLDQRPGKDQPVSSQPTGDEPDCDGGQSAPGHRGVEDCEGAFVPQNEEDQARCRSTYGASCFESDALACACAGCDLADCRIAASYPTQVFCDGQPSACDAGFEPDDGQPDATCQARTQGLCFEEITDACLCACGTPTCVVAESFPAQIFCE